MHCPDTLKEEKCMAVDRLLPTQEAADLITKAFEATIADKVVTYDFARLMEGAHEVKTSAFAEAVVDHL